MNDGRNEVIKGHAIQVIPEEIRLLLGGPPLIGGEDGALYSQLLSRVAVFVDPQNIIEWLYVRDILDHDWEIRRYRHMHATLVNAKLVGLIDPLLHIGAICDPAGDGEKLPEPLLNARDLFKSKSVDEIRTYLKDRGMDFDSKLAQAFGLCRKEIEALERMLASVESRRSAVFREITFHRNLGSFAKRLDETSSRLVASEPSDEALLVDHETESGPVAPELDDDVEVL
jgi:hypothetical protein